MQNNNNVEPWMEVCALAAREQDPKKFRELTNEVIRLLNDKDKRPSRAEISDGN